jgi:formamidopyrimidine-DNA glycosylase
MPEMPEVETIAADLRALQIEGAALCGITVYSPHAIAPLGEEAFSKALLGRRIEKVTRRGKQLLIQLEGGLYLGIHFRMSGHLLTAMKEMPCPHVQVLFNLSNGIELFFHDTRKFGRLRLYNDPSEWEGDFGPEALQVSLEELHRIVQSQRKLKTVLLDQRAIAGLGNIYVDEALWYSRIHPETTASRLTREQILALQKGIVKALSEGLKKGGTTIGHSRSNYRRLQAQPGENQRQLNAYHRTGLPCPRCGAPIARLLLAQRSTHYCPQCQSNNR